MGRDNFDENTDYRLYERSCEAYEYMFSHALINNSEVGAFITAQGVLMIPNNNAYTDALGVRHFSYGFIKEDQGGKYIETSDGKTYIYGMIHTHPGPFAQAIPSDTDLKTAVDYPTLAQYVISGFYMNQFSAIADTNGQPVLTNIVNLYNQQTVQCP